MLVEEGRTVAVRGAPFGPGRRHDHARAKREQDAALHPWDGGPLPFRRPRRRTHLAALELIEELLDHLHGVVGQTVAGLHREDLLDPAVEGSTLSPRHSAPAARSASRSDSRCSSASGTSGSLRTSSMRPSMDIAAFMGMGLLSANPVIMIGCRALIRLRAHARSPLSIASVSRLIGPGTALLTTETIPSPPSAITGTV